MNMNEIWFLHEIENMFKYQNFPIIKKDFYDHKGQLKRKSFRMKSV